MKKQIMILLILSVVFVSFANTQSKRSSKKNKSIPVLKDTSAVVSKPFVTFIEIGSVKCIPCRMMQPVMKAIEQKYGDQVKVVFYDVWQKEQAHFAQDYNVRLIPTQVFLDIKGKELMRHEGFFPEKDIDTFLQSKGLKPRTTDKG